MEKLICFQFARELGNATDALLISSAPGGQQAAASSSLSLLNFLYWKLK